MNLEKIFFKKKKKLLLKHYIKIGKGLFLKIIPIMFSNLINEEIKIDFIEYKKFDFGKNDKDCPNFIFLIFYEFIKEVFLTIMK